MRPTFLLPLALATLLSGCELLGIESAETLAAAKEADGKAIGSACRHAGRAIEDCYRLNGKAQRAAVFAGWREMDEYMRENKLDAVAPTLAPPVGKGAEPEVAAAVEAAPASPADAKPAAKGKAHGA
ncbi:MAG TPA: hypothetical protein VJM48_11295 [Methylibium sp.]|nr:hypothetical protein [Methylibium sp.]